MLSVRNTGVVLCARRSVAAAAGAILALAAGAAAQDARVYVANSANSRILGVQFEPPSTFVVIDDANRLTQARDIAIRDNGLNGSNLLVCDRNGGRIAFYANSTGTGQTVFDASQMDGPERPDGMSLDLEGNIFVMNSGQGSSGGVSQVWAIKRDTGCPGSGPHCLGGGYRAPLGLIDGDVHIPTQFGGSPALIAAESLPESAVARSSAGVLQAGDVLVLTNPGAMIRYSAAQVRAFLTVLAAGQVPAPLTPDTIIHPAGASVPLDQQFPAGAEPNGLAFGPSGEMLVVMSDGRVLIYNSDGRRRSNGAGFVDFAAGGGNDEFKIAVGLQNGKHRAFVTQQQRGELKRYAFNTDGTGTLDSVIGGFQFPVGIDASNSSTVPAPAGTNVSVVPTQVFSSQIERVVLPGLINARVSTFPDPRESEQAIPANQPLHRSLFLNELRADLPPLEVPAWARAFRLGDPNTGTPTFILVEADSNAMLAGLLDHRAIEAPILGYEPSCTDPVVTQQPFLFWAPDDNDPPIVEGDRFIDITTGCGSIRGMSWDYSYFLAGVRITQPLPALAGQKLAGIRAVIDGATCIRSQFARRLGSLMDRADRDFGRGRYPAVIESLQAIEAEILANPSALNGCATNVGGEIRSRCRSAVYVVGKLQ